MFEYIEKNIAKVLKRDQDALEFLIPRNAVIKARVVSADERESGLREILNFGHTFAHALEGVTKYRRFQHGEAVAWGMMAAALLAHETRVCDADYVSRIVALTRRIGPFPAWPEAPPSALIAAMRSDKKTHHGNIRFVLSPRLGKAGSYDSVPLEAVRKVLRFAPRFVTKSGIDRLAANA
jgi:3-dehydroquinate synthase